MIGILLGHGVAIPALAQTGLSERARAAFAEADLNNDGRLSRVEFDAAREEVFGRADADRNERLTWLELRALRPGDAPRVPSLRNRWRLSGATSRSMDITEFRAMGAARFTAADLNRDGGIDRSEIAAFFRNLGAGN